jgi:hypothetical protein
MSITLDLSPELEAHLRADAKANALPVEALAALKLNGFYSDARAAAILDGLHSDDGPTRNAAIVALSHADEETSRVVEEAAARAVKEWQGEEDDLSDWRALDSEPFHLSEEAPDFLTGLYRSDAKAEEAAA